MSALWPEGATVTRQTLAEGVYERVLDAILGGRLPAGEDLNAVALARELRVSRTPVQEALRRLQADGLVRYDERRKLTVARFTRTDVIEIYQVRGLLESAAAEMAAQAISEDALARLIEAAEELQDFRADPDWCRRAIEFDLLFHDRIAEGCGNRHLGQEIARYRRLVRGFCHLTGSPANLKAAFLEHQPILEAIRDGDPSSAREAMHIHIRNRLETVLSMVYCDGEVAQQVV